MENMLYKAPQLKKVKQIFTPLLVSSYQCPFGKTQTLYWDKVTPNLGLRVTASGCKSYIFESSLNNNSIRITVGNVNECSISEARDRVIKLKSLVNQGIDPRQLTIKKFARITLKPQEKDFTFRADSFGAIWQAYISEKVKTTDENKKPWSERHYSDHLKMIHAGGVQRKRCQLLTQPGALAFLVNLNLSEVTATKIYQWAVVEVQQRPTQTKVALRLLNAFLSWCSSHNVFSRLVSKNTAKNVAVILKTSIPHKKQTVLAPQELSIWFNEIHKIHPPEVSIYLQILLLTGRHPLQVANLKWTDIDFEKNSVTFHESAQKSSVIALTPYVAHLLQPLAHNDHYVFNNQFNRSSYATMVSALHNQACEEVELSLSLDGLRRSFSLFCEWIEMPYGITAQIQGLAIKKSQLQYHSERPLEVLQKWHVKMEAWILEQAQIELFDPIESFEPEESEDSAYLQQA